MEYLNIILGCFALAGFLGTVAGTFYGVRQKTIITTLQTSNTAYAERLKQVEEAFSRYQNETHTRITQLEGRTHTLERIKTPPIQPLFELVKHNHEEVMEALGVRE